MLFQWTIGHLKQVRVIYQECFQGATRKHNHGGAKIF